MQCASGLHFNERSHYRIYLFVVQPVSLFSCVLASLVYAARASMTSFIDKHERCCLGNAKRNCKTIRYIDFWAIPYEPVHPSGMQLSVAPNDTLTLNYIYRSLKRVCPRTESFSVMIMRHMHSFPSRSTRSCLTDDASICV